MSCVRALAARARVSSSIWCSAPLAQVSAKSCLTRPYAMVGPSANRRAAAMAASASSSSGTTWVMRLIPNASCAVRVGFSSASRCATRSPTSRGRNQVEPPSGLMPDAVYAILNLALSAAITMSPVIAKLKPPPPAAPWIAMTTGALARRSRDTAAWK